MARLIATLRGYSAGRSFRAGMPRPITPTAPPHDYLFDADRRIPLHGFVPYDGHSHVISNGAISLQSAVIRTSRVWDIMSPPIRPCMRCFAPAIALSLPISCWIRTVNQIARILPELIPPSRTLLEPSASARYSSATKHGERPSPVMSSWSVRSNSTRCRDARPFTRALHPDTSPNPASTLLRFRCAGRSRVLRTSRQTRGHA